MKVSIVFPFGKSFLPKFLRLLNVTLKWLDTKNFVSTVFQFQKLLIKYHIKN